MGEYARVFLDSIVRLSKWSYCVRSIGEVTTSSSTSGSAIGGASSPATAYFTQLYTFITSLPWRRPDLEVVLVFPWLVCTSSLLPGVESVCMAIMLVGTRPEDVYEKFCASGLFGEVAPAAAPLSEEVVDKTASPSRAVTAPAAD